MQKLLNIDNIVIQSTYWMIYSAAGIFVSVFLLNKGYSNTSIGMIIAVGNVLAILMQTIIANITDRISRITDISVIKAFILLLFLLAVCILLIGRKSPALTVAYAALIVVHTAMHPFVNALSFTLEVGGHKVSYGLGRSMGSLTAGIICAVMGYLVSWFSPDAVLYAALVNLAIMTVFIFITGRHYRMILPVAPPISEYETDEQPIDMMEFIRRNKIFMIMSTGIVALFFGNVVLENFTIQIIQSIGGDTEQMGIVIFLLSIFEMPAMLTFSKLKERFSYVFLLRTASVFFSIKIVMMLFAGSMTTVYLAQLNQILGYGLLFPAIVSFIDHIMDRREALRGQTVFTAALTIGNVLGSVFGGSILDAYSASALLLVSSVISICGTLIIAVFVGKISRQPYDSPLTDAGF